MLAKQRALGKNAAGVSCPQLLEFVSADSPTPPFRPGTASIFVSYDSIVGLDFIVVWNPRGVASQQMMS